MDQQQPIPATTRNLWWDDISERITLARWMVEDGRLGQADVLDVIEKPRKFTMDYTDMCAEMTRERRLAVIL